MHQDLIRKRKDEKEIWKRDLKTQALPNNGATSSVAQMVKKKKTAPSLSIPSWQLLY